MAKARCRTARHLADISDDGGGWLRPARNGHSAAKTVTIELRIPFSAKHR